ncbi:MAG: UDP-N-acetylglucosamine 2-epimerase (non-hydrolyzing) [Bacteroidota bacterium]|nr:UDP-N-acetylglucosamine 2-epimerase (non-hydrolyzing) [Bacteroidota bacterium]
MKTIATIFGTRPDTIKMAPVIVELQKYPGEFRTFNIATAQHRQMLDQVLSVFDIAPDLDLGIMLPKQSLAQITGNIMSKLDEALSEAKADLVLVQGDTTTTFVGSLAAFYHRIPVGHLEAGLRTNDKFNPFPEEINRRLTSAVTDLHFAPTASAKKALLKEHIDPVSIFITGNTVIDALRTAVDPAYHFSDAVLQRVVGEKERDGKDIILITTHRRENWGEPMMDICSAIKKLSLHYSRLNFVFPVHLNPVVRSTVFPVLQGLNNVFLIEPLEYKSFVNVMNHSHLILTDSGGVQEEAPSLGKPVLVMRKVTERPEAVKAGAVKLVGMNPENVYEETSSLLDHPREYKAMASSVNPYGDGNAAQRTVDAIRYFFGMTKKRPKDFSPQPPKHKHRRH